MSEGPPSSDPPRPPKQERSRRSWAKVLAAATDILVEEGRDSFTVARVCERAGVAPTVIYRRVEGILGLFWAVYEEGMRPIMLEQRRQLERARGLPVGTGERVHFVIEAAGATFESNLRFLTPVMRYATGDAAMSERGSPESFEMVSLIEELLDDGDEEAAHDVARMVHSECAMRALYGPRWLEGAPENFDAFIRRMERMALARLSIET